MAPKPESETETESSPEATAPDENGTTDSDGAAETTNDASRNDETEQGVEVQSPEFQEFDAQNGGGSASEISRFQNIKVTVSAELGRTNIPIQKLLTLGNGSVLELDRAIDSPIELIAQGVPLASGEVVVVDDCFAVRITEVYPTQPKT